jgi:hypothetical protein
MLRIWRTNSNHVLDYGLLMLGLGTLLFSAEPLMCNPALADFGYRLATALTILCLLVPAVHIAILTSTSSRRQIAQYLLMVEVTLACWLAYWQLQSAPLDLRFLLLLAGLHGVVWGLWLVGLAFRFHLYQGTSITLCILAASTSALGVILATQSALTKISAVTIMACYATYIGLEMLAVGWFVSCYMQPEKKLLPSGEALEHIHAVAVLHTSQEMSLRLPNGPDIHAQLLLSESKE